MKLEELLLEDYKELTRLLDKWLPKADQEETAVNAVVKLIKQREQTLVKYNEITPDDDSQLERFRKQREERKNKNSRKFKTKP